MTQLIQKRTESAEASRDHFVRYVAFVWRAHGLDSRHERQAHARRRPAANRRSIAPVAADAAEAIYPEEESDEA